MSIFGVSADRLLGLWPGLSAAWFRGRFGGLLIALGFAVVLEIALLSTTVWPVWLGPIPVPVVWFCVVLYWLATVLPAFRSGTLGNRGVPLRGARRLDLLREAQTEYLTGNWLRTEERLLVLLDGDDSDVEVLLMLATLCRRLNRGEEARCHLELASSFDRTAKWRWEIDHERSRLERQQKRIGIDVDGRATARGTSAYAA